MRGEWIRKKSKASFEDRGKPGGARNSEEKKNRIGEERGQTSQLDYGNNEV